MSEGKNRVNEVYLAFLKFETTSPSLYVGAGAPLLGGQSILITACR